VRKSIMPIFDMDRTETNRVAGQVFNLVRASAAINYDSRRSVTVEMNGHELDSYVAGPADVANVMSCRKTLLAKTHQLDQIKREILDAIRSQQHFDEDADEGVGVTLDSIHDYLQHSSALSVPRKGKMRDLLEEMAEHYYVSIHERAASDGTSHLYEFQSLRDIGVPRVSNLAQYMNEDELVRSRELAPGVDLSSPFDGVRDPFRDQPFVETVEQMRSEFAANPAERAAQTADLVAEDGSDSDNPQGSEGEMTLAGAMGGDDTDGADGQPSGRVEEAVYDRLREHADTTVWEVDSVQDLHFVGAVDKGQRVS
jgi:hypothetical protein